MNKNLTMLTTALATGLCFAGVQPANAQANCAPRAIVVERLAAEYGEARQSLGLGQNNAVMELFASEDTGTWTITVTTVNGLTCLVASGQAFEAVTEALPAQGSPA